MGLGQNRNGNRLAFRVVSKQLLLGIRPIVRIQGHGKHSRGNRMDRAMGLGVQHTLARYQGDITNIESLDLKRLVYTLIDPRIIIHFSIFTPMRDEEII